MINTLNIGMKITPGRMLTDIQINYWQYAGECDGILGGLMPGAELEIVEVNRIAGAMWIRVKLPGAYPPKFLKIAGQEYAQNFRVK